MFYKLLWKVASFFFVIIHKSIFNYFLKFSNCQFKFKSVIVDNIKSCPEDLCLHGTCKMPMKLKNTFYCVCDPGWMGTRCDIRNHCVSSVCENGGTCINNVNDYICKCKENYFGNNCEKSGNYYEI